MRWPLQPLQPFQQTQLQPPFGQSVASLCHPWFTTTNFSYRFPIFETSATALCGTTGNSWLCLYMFHELHGWFLIGRLVSAALVPEWLGWHEHADFGDPSCLYMHLSTSANFLHLSSFPKAKNLVSDNLFMSFLFTKRLTDSCGKLLPLPKEICPFAGSLFPKERRPSMIHKWVL